MGKFIITEEEKKHILGLYEQTSHSAPKEFKIGSDLYRVQKLTGLNNGWSQLDYVKVLPNGMVEKKLNVGFTNRNNPNFIYQSSNSNSPKIGPVDFGGKPTQSGTNLESLIDGLSKTYKCEVIMRGNEIYVGNNMKVVMDRNNQNMINGIDVAPIKTIDGQTLRSIYKDLKIDLSTTNLSDVLSKISKLKNELNNSQNDYFKTTLKKTKPTTTRDVPYQGTEVKI